ncbi:alpha/beta fold hydrolase [Halorubrum sp. DTA98]|uniref:alpha/beta fold hydrolase n=1 Tax=Halorubrum sp. DTA98 TaxID=3402163 RepID=UPI003AACBD8B
MPYANNGDVSIRYEVDEGGIGDRDEAVVFCGDVGLGAWQFGWQHAALAGPHTVIAPETRGVGRSDAPDGPYTVEQLASDVDAVCAAEGIRNAHLVGYGLGGMVALAYGMASSRPASLVLVGTPPSGDAYNPAGVWADPATPNAVEGSLTGLLSAGFREAHPDALSRITEWRCSEDAPPAVFEAHRAAIAAFDRSDRLYEATTPALVVHGGEDTVCPITAGESLAAGLPRGEAFVVDDARHFVGIEASAAVNDAVVGWLAEHASTTIE